MLKQLERELAISLAYGHWTRIVRHYGSVLVALALVVGIVCALGEVTIGSVEAGVDDVGSSAGGAGADAGGLGRDGNSQEGGGQGELHLVGEGRTSENAGKRQMCIGG